MGHCSASDAYTKRYDDAVVDIDRKLKCVDDVLLFDHGIEQAFWHCWNYLEACGRAGVTLSPEKFSFCKREVECVGFKLGWDAYGPAHGKLTAIADFPMLSNPTVTDIGSLDGDGTYQLLRQRVEENGWPESCSEEVSELKAFSKVRDRLSMVDGLVCYSHESGPLRLVIPESLRKRIAENLRVFQKEFFFFKSPIMTRNIE